MPISRLHSSALALTLFSAALVPAQAETYQTPHPALQAIVDAPQLPVPHLGPKKTLVAMLEYPTLPPISAVAEEELKLAGFRIHPRAWAESKFQFGHKLWLQALDKMDKREISGLPAPLAIANLAWSPDQRYLAFTQRTTNGMQLWLVDVAQGRAQLASKEYLNAVLSDGFSWLPNSRSLLLHLRPGTPPPASGKQTPTGPNAQDSAAGSKQKQLRTYQDLLKNEQDDALFNYYTTAQLALLEVGGKLQKIGNPQAYASVEVSPNGQYILAQILQQPWSRLVPADYFGNRFEVHDLKGKLVHALGKRELQEGLAAGADAVLSGMRDLHWRADSPATLAWVEALDGGDPNQKTEMRDALYTLAAPFSGEKRLLLKVGTRVDHVYWGRGDVALVRERWIKTRQQKLWRINPDSAQGTAEAEKELLFATSYEDRYNDPGKPVQVRDANGFRRLHLHGQNEIFLHGDGASKEGDKPFLDRFDLRSKTRTRLFQSSAPYFEDVKAILNDDGSALLQTRETPTEPPNYYRRDLKKGENGSDKVTTLTAFAHPYPQLREVKKEKISYQRKDGVQLNADLYLPPGYDAKRDGPLPMLMWAYPQEFKSNDAAGQIKGSPYTFNRIRLGSPLPFLARGYAILDNLSMPIVGTGEQEPNDSYLPQLTANAQAAVDAMVARGVADRNKIAIGGHSYGAFMTANLLAHTRLFRAGIARSGAYNRTLTPFGFQAEERNFWNAKAVYQAMSPFNFAEQIKDPLLIIHGEQDNNPGTYPLQSERLFQALKGLGATSRLVMLPNESHAYRARESMLQVFHETDTWLEKYVKNAAPKP